METKEKKFKKGIFELKTTGKLLGGDTCGFSEPMWPFKDRLENP